MALFKFIAFIGAVAMLIAVAPPSPAILFYAQMRQHHLIASEFAQLIV